MSSAEEHLKNFLEAVGLSGDPELERTPQLVAELLRTFASPIEGHEVFTLPTPGSDPVVLRDLSFYSICAHHLLPFFGSATIAYVPAGRIAGLGSLVRALEHFATRPQLQERLGSQLADHLLDQLSASVVVVRLEARQMCREMRGTHSQATVVTQAIRGRGNSDRLEALIRNG